MGTARARMGRSEPTGQLCLKARTLLGCRHISERAQVEHSLDLAFRKFSGNKNISLLDHPLQMSS